MIKTGKIWIGLVILFLILPNLLAWTPTSRLTWNIGNSLNPEMAFDQSDVIHIVWADHTPGNYEIYYKQSGNNGSSWSALKRITWNAGASDTPKIAVDWTGKLHVIWSDSSFPSYELLYKSSTDSGSSWQATKRMTYTSTNSRFPDIAADLNNVYVVWGGFQAGYDQLFFKKSPDKGANWTIPQQLTWTTSGSYVPAMSVNSNGHIHLVWHEYILANIEICHKRSTDGGVTWSSPKRLTYLSGDSICPAVITDNFNGVYVVWEDRVNSEYQIYFKSSTDGGLTWTGAKKMTWNVGYTDSPKILVQSGYNMFGFPFVDVHVVYRDSTPGNYEIFYKKSTDVGATWSAPQRITWNITDSDHPTIRKDFATSYINIAWADRYKGVGGNHEIYFKRE